MNKDGYIAPDYAAENSVMLAVLLVRCGSPYYAHSSGVISGVTQLLEIGYPNFVILTAILIRPRTNPGKNLCDQHERAGNMKK